MLFVNAAGTGYSAAALPGPTFFVQGSNFADIDGDGDVDFHISKCRQDVGNSAGPRRVNMLSRGGDRSWTELGEVAGLALGEQSWTADFGELDADGDRDVFVVNHYDPSVLLRNTGDGTFTDVTAASGLVGEIDLSSDGFIDVYASYANPLSGPSAIPDRMFLNAGNSDNWLEVGLEGTTSHRDGVGARVEIAVGSSRQVRAVIRSWACARRTPATRGARSSGRPPTIVPTQRP